jgi:hypothetical protein
MNGFESWLVPFRERRLSVFDKLELRGLFCAKNDEVAGERRKIHEMLDLMYCFPNNV